MARPLHIPHTEIRNFATSDERLRDRGWHMALIGGTYRDADAVAQSNARVILRLLAEVDPEQAHHGTLHCGHWAVGWYDHLIVDPKSEAVARVLAECVRALSEYPILDEHDLSQLESDLHSDGSCGDGCPLCEYNRDNGEG